MKRTPFQFVSTFVILAVVGCMHAREKNPHNSSTIKQHPTQTQEFISGTLSSGEDRAFVLRKNRNGNPVLIIYGGFSSGSHPGLQASRLLMEDFQLNDVSTYPPVSKLKKQWEKTSRIPGRPLKQTETVRAPNKKLYGAVKSTYDEDQNLLYVVGTDANGIPKLIVYGIGKNRKLKLLAARSLQYDLYIVDFYIGEEQRAHKTKPSIKNLNEMYQNQKEKQIQNHNNQDVSSPPEQLDLHLLSVPSDGQPDYLYIFTNRIPQGGPRLLVYSFQKNKRLKLVAARSLKYDTRVNYSTETDSDSNEQKSK